MSGSSALSAPPVQRRKSSEKSTMAWRSRRCRTGG